MATSGLWQRIASSVTLATEGERSAGDGKMKLWMALDVMTVVASAFVSTLFEFRVQPVSGARNFWHGRLIHGCSTGLLLALLGWFALSLVFTSRGLHLYAPKRLASLLNEQRLSLQACLTSGLLLTGSLYVIHADDVPRGIVLSTILLVTASLSLRRLLYRLLLYRRYVHGVGMRNVLIVGTGPEACALQKYLGTVRRLGYSFKGFVAVGQASCVQEDEVVGSLETLFQHVRQLFVDEIFFSVPCEHQTMQTVLEQARDLGVDLRLIPNTYNGLGWNHPVEYLGQFLTVPLHCGQVREVSLFLKRVFDLAFSAMVLALSSPVLLAIAIAIRLDSPGPALYRAERIGKKGRVFPCYKFRTMVRDAEKLRAQLLERNERDGVLFKVSNDPRITRLGRFLRKYSLDELPQFLNVLRGDMSVVGPRPPLAGEVKKYELNHLRRLSVTPGITGLWQVQGRQNPSFASYVSLDATYIDNWSIWLDFKIILRTIGVVFSGTGS
jgi:exopolysaccharide biosynthesis polyprenyl glycosylphosphotransferase